MLKAGVGKEITSIGSEVAKAVIENMMEKALDFIQSGGHHLKKIVSEHWQSKIIHCKDYNATLVSKIRNLNLELLNYVLGPVFINHPVSQHVPICTLLRFWVFPPLLGVAVVPGGKALAGERHLVVQNLLDCDIFIPWIGSWVCLQYIDDWLLYIILVTEEALLSFETTLAFY